MLEAGISLSPPSGIQHFAAEVVPFDESLATAWDSFVLTHPAGTFFHQTAWKRAIEKSYGYRPLYFCVKRGGKITGIAPTFLVSNWVTGRSLISLPFAVYGGVCASDAQSEQALLTRLEQIAAKEQVDYLELRNRNGDLFQDYQLNPRYATFTLPVLADADSLYAKLPKDVRYMIRKGEKARLRAQRGLEQLDAFYRLMTINLRRLGTPAFPRAWFKNLICEYPGQVDLTVIYANNEAVAGGMSFFFRDSLQPYYIGSTEAGRTLGANNFLWWQLIRLAAETRCQTFDFGRSKKGSGNYDFKKRWNPQIELLNYQVRLFRRGDLPNFSPANPKFELATAMWKRIPLGLTRLIGPRLIRWFP